MEPGPSIVRRRWEKTNGKIGNLKGTRRRSMIGKIRMVFKLNHAWGPPTANDITNDVLGNVNGTGNSRKTDSENGKIEQYVLPLAPMETRRCEFETRSGTRSSLRIAKTEFGI